MASQVAGRQSARTFELQRRKFALMAAEHVRALGERIRLRREELGMTQDEVARKMQGSVDGQRVSKWERGENRPRDESLEDLARVLKTSATTLLAPAPNGNETPDPFPPAVEPALTEILAAITAQLAERTKVLERIEQALSRDQQARAELDESAERLQAAVADASRALRVETPSPAATPERQAK